MKHHKIPHSGGYEAFAFIESPEYNSERGVNRVKLWSEITCPFLNFIGEAIEVGNG